MPTFLFCFLVLGVILFEVLPKIIFRLHEESFCEQIAPESWEQLHEAFDFLGRWLLFALCGRGFDDWWLLIFRRHVYIHTEEILLELINPLLSRAWGQAKVSQVWMPQVWLRVLVCPT